MRCLACVQAIEEPLRGAKEEQAQPPEVEGEDIEALDAGAQQEEGGEEAAPRKSVWTWVNGLLGTGKEGRSDGSGTAVVSAGAADDAGGAQKYLVRPCMYPSKCHHLPFHDVSAQGACVHACMHAPAVLHAVAVHEVSCEGACAQDAMKSLRGRAGFTGELKVGEGQG